MAGQIIHGCRLGVMDHYLDPGRHLLKFAGGVKVPLEFLPADQRSRRDLEAATMRQLYERASEANQRLMLALARELA